MPPSRPVFAAIFATAVGCSSKTPFPAGLGPLENNKASWPADGEETLSTRFGEESEKDDGYHWGHART